MKLRLYVEDQYFESYEILARKWLDAYGRSGYVRAVTLRLDRMRDEMYKYVIRAHKDGFNCVVFVADRETTHERSDVIQTLRLSFDRLCQALDNDPILQNVKVGLVIARSCLESWLLTDTQGIVCFACRRGKHVNYTPKQPGKTESFSPKKAYGEITHILRETAKRAGKHNLKRVKYEKSAAPDIIEQMGDLSQAAHRNRSLRYFLKMVTCEVSGCDELQ